FKGPVWIVDNDDGTSSGEGSPEEPMKYIEDAIQESADGDTIMLMPGTYDHSKNRNLNFQEQYDGPGVRNVTLMSKYGPDTTIIDLAGENFTNLVQGEFDTKIEGLTITNSNSGAIVIDWSSVEIENCIFENNQKNNSGNWGGLSGGAINVVWILNNPVRIKNTLFKGNSSTESGGAINIASGDVAGDVYIENCIFYDNSAEFEGGAIYQDNNSKDLVIINSLFMNNNATSSYGAGGVGSNAGSAGGACSIINSIFTGNVNSFGHADVNTMGYTNDIDHCVLQSETSPVFSYGENYVFDPLINNALESDFSLNDSSNAIGKGIDEYYNPILDDDVVVPETDFLGNARPGSSGGNPDIGAIEHWRWEPRRKVFYVDTAGDDSNDGLTVDDPLLTIQEALAQAGIRDTIELAAGTYSGSGNRDLSMAGTTRIIRSSAGPANTIIDCESVGRAFVFENNETDSVLITGITITNGTGDDGGAVYINNADPRFEGIIFINNIATGSGGAVYTSNSNSAFVNCIFNGNHAAESGAAAISNGDVTMDFCTAVGNRGADDVSFSGALTISNSILWRNSDLGSSVSVSYSDVMGGASGTGNYNGRPGFIDGPNGDFRLQDWSPVIGQANGSSNVLHDLEGNARPSNNPDMGAYENALDTAGTYTSQVWVVATTGSDSANVGSSDNPFKTIQYALNHAIYSDQVNILAGTYNESLNNWGKDILVVGSGGAPDAVQIDGFFEITGGSPALYDLHLTNVNGTSDALQINNDAVVTMYNLLITDSNYGGVTINNTAIAYIFQSTIYGNATGIYDNSTGTVSAVNSIIWNNTAATYGTPTITYSDVEGGYTGTGNINSNPVFVDSLNGDFNLQITSPCIDTGDPTSDYDSDSTIADMGAFPLIREFLAGTSDGNIDISSDESAVITNNFTVVSGDTLSIDPGATVYFDPGVTLIIDGVMASSGEAGNPIVFQCSNPDSTYGGVDVNAGSGTRTATTYEYMLITDVHADSVPLSISGDATLNHMTIAGNGNTTYSLEMRDGNVETVLTVKNTITEGYFTGLGVLIPTNYYYNSTDQFVDYANGDFTLLSTAAAIDIDTTGDFIDPDNSFADAGCFYHDQSGYLSDSIVVLYPVYGDTIIVNPDTSSAVSAGLAVEVQVFNTLGHYMTNPTIQWGNAGLQFGTYASDFTTGADLRGRVSNTYYTTTTTDDLNSISADESGTTAQGGFFKVVPGAPDSVWVNEQDEMSMTQLGTLGFGASIYDQFANLVADGETVDWNVVPVVGNGDGFSLSYDSSSTSGGSVNVALATDPTG
ncbi:MAG: right-handed parallel beta-helix repeat-containing protein, partial [Candidatus Marinimicrobia bacterium]|nr:right-handed parallel beta-helix repeat-containing protein [Candidatus Neomarinimicrobiota bacterium]